MTFTHHQSAHCESGVMSALLTHRGLPISEPMVFGLANALVFAYIPLIRLAGQPLVSYRLPPKSIIKGISKRLGIGIRFQTFSSPEKAQAVLDETLAEKPVGLQTSVYWLPYFPEQMRFHFNAHNLVVYGREGNEYLISDPVFEEPMKVAPIHLTKARFAKGPLAPRGLMYTVDTVPGEIDYPRVIPAAIRKNHRIMTKAPLPVIGIRGIRTVSRKIRKLGRTDSARGEAALFLGHLVRMQEEIGTGGAGFRFMYASFLEEAGQLLSAPALLDASVQMTRAGDTWRDFAVACVTYCRNADRVDLDGVADALERCAEQEAAVWQLLGDWSR